MFALDSLRIGRFRGLRDLSLDGLGRVNLLVGPNNTGKTSILEAVAVFCRPLDLRTWIEATWQREVPAKPEAPFFPAMEWMFPHLELDGETVVSGEVAITGSGKAPFREVRATYEAKTRVGTRVPSTTVYMPFEQPGARIQVVGHATRADGTPEVQEEIFELWEGDPVALPELTRRTTLPIRTVTPVSHRVEEIQLHELSQATQSGLKHRILTMLRSLDSQIRDVEILSPRGKKPAIYIDYAYSGLIPLTGFGDGVRRAFLISVVLNSLSGGVLLIDEIESSLHVSALESLFSWLVRSCEEFDVQLFATTHSLEAVDAMIQAEKGNVSRIVGYRLEASSGSIEVQRLAGELLSRMRYERGLDVRL
jgi:hypothetical protein